MVLVDSSVWISYFAGHKTNESQFLNDLLKKRADISIIHIILTEVLAGFKTDKDFYAAAGVLHSIPSIPINRETCIQAARLFRNLRKNGITVRGAIDCVIAQCCIETQSELLTIDRDFRAISQFIPLKLSL